MPTLTRYFIKRIGITIGLLWLGLTFLIVIFQLLADWEDRELTTAMVLAVFQAPRLSLEILPFTCVIGAAIALQRMEEAQELNVLRAAGLSLMQITYLTAIGGLVFATAIIFISELVLEPAETIVRSVKKTSLNKGHVWLHNDGVYLYAKSISPDGALKNIIVYTPRDNRLNILKADSAQAAKELWQLTNSQNIIFANKRVERQSFGDIEWYFPVAQSVLKTIIKRPREMSIVTLATAASGARVSGRGASLAVALWRRGASIPAAPLLAATAIWCLGIRKNIAFAIIIAAAISSAYYLAVIISAQFALLFQLPPLTIIPLCLIAVIFIIGARRQFI